MYSTTHFYHFYIWFKYDLGQKYYAHLLRPDWGSNSWPLDHNSKFHVTKMPAQTTQPSVTSRLQPDNNFVPWD